MTNFEKYYWKIREIIKEDGLDVLTIDKNGEITRCSSDLGCSQCRFNEDTCSEQLLDWLYRDPEPCEECKHFAGFMEDDDYPECQECRYNYGSNFTPIDKKPTRMDKFLEQHPDASLYCGVPKIFPCYIDSEKYGCAGIYPSETATACIECCKKYWLQEIGK